MTDFTLALTVNQVKGSLHVPVRTLEQRALEHLELYVKIDFSFEVVGHGFLHCWVKLLTILDIHLVSLALADVLTKLGRVTREDELDEFVVGEGATTIEVVEAHH